MNNSNAFTEFTTKHKGAVIVASIFIVLGVGWAVLYRDTVMSMIGRMKSASVTSVKQERKVLYWHDPMVPGQRFDQPGKSPFMDMQLVPVYADSASDITAQTGVTINARTLQNLGMRTVKVALGNFPAMLDAIGIIKSDERKIEVMQSRSGGWIERLQVRAVNDAVQVGQVVAEIYSPDLLAAQEEFLLVRHTQQDKKDDDLMKAARARLRLLGLSIDQIQQLESSGQSQRLVALTSPINGVVSELNVRQGAFVPAGGSIATITDLSSVWLIVEVPENQIGGLKPGSNADIRLAALAGKAFSGTVDYVYPSVTTASRTLKVRIVLDNATGELKPDMFARVLLHSSEEAKVLMLPSEAVITTGKRNVAVVAEGGGKFMSIDVKIGREQDGKTEILEGLSEGQTVVASGQFLIDSESSLKNIKSLESIPASTK